MEIAKTILEQLGGAGRLKMMTGANNFTAVKNGVTFSIKNRKVNYIKITLNSRDLYDVYFYKLAVGKLKLLSEHNDIYFDELIPLFEKETGMYLTFYLKGGRIKNDESKDMIFSQLKQIHHHEEELRQIIAKDEDIEPWVIAKIARATNDLSDVTHYEDGKTSKMATGGAIEKYNIKNKTKYWIYDGDNLEMAGIVSILPNNYIQIKDPKGFVYPLSLLEQKYKNLKFEIYEKFAKGGNLYSYLEGTTFEFSNELHRVKKVELVNKKFKVITTENETFDLDTLLKKGVMFQNKPEKQKRKGLQQKELQNKNSVKIKQLENERKLLMLDMEQEAEPEGGPIANRYGRLLNSLDKKIDLLKYGKQTTSMTYEEAMKAPKKEKGGEVNEIEYPVIINSHKTSLHLTISEAEKFAIKNDLKLVLFNDFPSGIKFYEITFEKLKDLIANKKYRYLEIYLNKYTKDGMFDNSAVKLKYATGGEVGEMVFKNEKYHITYEVKSSPTKKGVWVVIETSPDWKESFSYSFTSKKDAMNYAKISAGVKNENDPEKDFMQDEYAQGGPIIIEKKWGKETDFQNLLQLLNSNKFADLQKASKIYESLTDEQKNKMFKFFITKEDEKTTLKEQKESFENYLYQHQYSKGGSIPSPEMYTEVYDYVIGGNRPTDFEKLKEKVETFSRKLNLSVKQLYHEIKDDEESSENYKYQH